MPEIPQKALQAAAVALAAYYAGPGGEPDLTAASFNDEARAALEAAAPILAEQERADERRKVAEEIRALVDDSGPYPMAAWRAFKSRHKRLVTGDSVVAVLLAVADEIEGAARDPR